MKLKVYSSLTVSRDEVRKILPGAVVAPPIRRGDLAKDIAAGFHAVAIIDGAFQQTLAVSPSEILDALRCGIRVYGSSSMGALRAGELYSHGMVGHGKIFEQVRARDYYRDDHLGLAFDMESGRLLSMPFVDFQAKARRLLSRKALSPRDFNTVCRLLAGMHFTERRLSGLLTEINGRYGPRLAAAARKIWSLAVSQKKEDALSLLRKIKGEARRVAAANARVWERQARSRPVPASLRK